MPRFVILAHDWPTLHWDLLLEDGDVLLSWRLLAEPKASATIPVERIADHRKLYLDYEGPVSGDRGTVTRWDAGTFEWIEKEIAARLKGFRITGTIHFTDGVCTIV
jgi:DNA polymerase Ligase (LigD)